MVVVLPAPLGPRKPKTWQVLPAALDHDVAVGAGELDDDDVALLEVAPDVAEHRLVAVERVAAHRLHTDALDHRHVVISVH
jgi:galactokinase